MRRMPGWAPPGIAADSDVTRFNLRKGWLLPGEKGSAKDPEVILPPGFDPRMRGQGVQVVVSPPGTAPPPVGIHYQPRNGRVYGPEEHPQADSLTLSVVPAIGGAPTDPTMMPPNMLPNMGSSMPPGGPAGPPMLPRGMPMQGPPPMMPGAGRPPVGVPPAPTGVGPGAGAGQDVPPIPQGTLRPKPKTAAEKQRIQDLPKAAPVPESGPPVAAQSPDPSPMSPLQLGIQEVLQSLIAAAGLGDKNATTGTGEDSHRVGAGAAREGVDQNSIPTLDPAAAAAFCGPAALLFMIQMHRPPTAEEAQALRENAQKAGWTPGAGMGGPAAFQKLAKAYNVDLTQVPNDPNQIAKHIQAGQPLVVSTPGHYWQLGDYDPTNQKFLAVDTVGRNRWLTLDEIQKDKYGGPIQAVWAAPGENPSQTTSGLANVPENVRGQILQVAQQEGVDPALLAAVIKQESHFDNNARSPAGAIGITQLMPATARALGVKDPTDLMQNLIGGAKLLKQNLEKTGGNVEQALSMYNSGKPDAYTDKVEGYSETKKYVPLVMQFYNEFKKGMSPTDRPAGALGAQPIDNRPSSPSSVSYRPSEGIPSSPGIRPLQPNRNDLGQIGMKPPESRAGGLPEFGAGLVDYGSGQASPGRASAKTGQDNRVGSGQGEGQQAVQILQQAAAQIARVPPDRVRPVIQGGKVVAFDTPIGRVPVTMAANVLVQQGVITPDNAIEISRNGGVQVAQPQQNPLQGVTDAIGTALQTLTPASGLPQNIPTPQQPMRPQSEERAAALGYTRPPAPISPTETGDVNQASAGNLPQSWERAAALGYGNVPDPDAQAAYDAARATTPGASSSSSLLPGGMGTPQVHAPIGWATDPDGNVLTNSDYPGSRYMNFTITRATWSAPSLLVRTMRRSKARATRSYCSASAMRTMRRCARSGRRRSRRINCRARTSSIRRAHSPSGKPRSIRTGRRRSPRHRMRMRWRTRAP